MTNEEAIQSIEIAIAEVEWEYPMEYAAAFEKAIEAIEKQIPKKPKGIYLISSGCSRLGSCSCGALIHEYITFCPKCGQALDWSDEK